jgi:hypothetical protein
VTDCVVEDVELSSSWGKNGGSSHLGHPSAIEAPLILLSGNRDDRLEAALETAMIVLRMCLRFPDGGIPALVSESALNFVVA